MSSPDTTVVFRIWTDKNRRGRYLTVRIFPTREEMREHIHAAPGWRERRSYAANCEAITRTYSAVLTKRGGRLQRTRKLGEVLFHRGNLGSGIVTHEMGHAALHWSSLRRWSMALTVGHASRGEERLCWVLGWLVTQFWRPYYRAVPHDEPKPS